MLRAVGLAACGRAPLTGGMTCQGLLLLTKDGACCIFIQSPRLQPLDHMELPRGDHHPPMCLDWQERLLQERRNFKLVHICSSSVNAICRHFSTSGLHISNASVQMSQNRDSEGQAKRHCCTACPWCCPHRGHRASLVSHGAPYPGHRSVPQSHGPNLSRLTAKRGNHDVPCAFGTSFCG